MKIGVLNDFLAPTLSYTKADGSTPAAKVEGDPLKGEPLVIHWQQLLEQPLFLTVELGARCYLSDLVLLLGDAGAPHTVTVWDADKTRILCRHTAETGENISKKELTLTVGEELSSLVIQLDVYFSTLEIQGIQLYGAALDEPLLFPVPREMKKGTGVLPLSFLTSIGAEGETAVAAARVIAARLAEQASLACTCAAEGALQLITDQSLSENAYRLSVTEQGATLAAADLRGFVYGGENLIKLIDGQGIACCEIEDAPYMPFRGVHLMLPGAENIEFAKRLVRHVISPMGYNAVIIEVAGGMRFDSHPEITEAVINAKKRARAGEWPKFPHASVGGDTCLEKSDAAELADYIRSFGIDVIPEVQSLGHVQFMTLAHPEIAERDEAEEEIVDELAADVPPKRFYPHCYCPSNERSYEILFDLMDEIIEVFKPQKYVHIGHDEVYQIGVCPICRAKDPARLFADDVQRLYDHLAAKGLKTMMWSDMLQPVTKYLTPAAADLLAKDIMMLDFIWYFHMDKDIEDNLLSKGFSLAYGNLYSSHFPRYESRIAKQGVVGGQISAWVATSEHALGKEGKIYDMLFTAQMLWSAEYTQHLRLVYDRKLKALMPRLRAALRAQSPLTGEEITLFASKQTAPYTATDAPAEIAVGQHCKALILEQVTTQKLTRTPWVALDVLGCYRVQYADGSSVEIPIEYGGNIGHWARRQNQPLAGGYYRHTGYLNSYFTDGIEGKTAEGQPVTVYHYEWRNPHPEKQIASLSLCENGVHPTSVVLLRLAALAAQ